MHTIQTPQTPMVRPWKYDHFNIDNYPLGTNAIVAVISYTVSVYHIFTNILWFVYACESMSCIVYSMQVHDVYVC